jgi:hypothetical protein
VTKLLKNKKEILREFNKEKYLSFINKMNEKKKKNFDSLNQVDSMLYGKKFTNDKLKKIKDLILSYIVKHTTRKQTIVEIGCGYGSIGLDLIQNHKFKKNKFIFLDISHNATKLLKIISKNLKISKQQFQTGYIDIYNCSIDKKIDVPNNSLFFSHSSMHYKKKHNDKFISFLCNLKFKDILFFEPIFEHNLKKKTTINYLKKNNYSENLLNTLQNSKKIKITFEKKNIYKIKLLPYSLIVIKKN